VNSPISIKQTLVLFIKAPIVGQVKTRLQPDLSPDKAVKVYKAMVMDLLEMLSQLNIPIVLHYTPADSEDLIRNWLGQTYSFNPQQGDDLGSRMSHALTSTFNEGVDQAILIGSDIPELNAEIIQTAFQKLDENDLVIGPTLDGGYYLIGINRPRPELFTGIHWSTETVFSETLTVARSLDMDVAELEPLSDIDFPNDLKALLERLNHRPERSRKDHPGLYPLLSNIWK